jgi:hypothetical protein
LAAASVIQQVKVRIASKEENKLSSPSHTAIADASTIQGSRVLSFETAQSAEMLHRADWIKDQVELNPHFKAVSVESWDAWRIAWKAASAETKSMYREMSQATSTIASGIKHDTTAALTDFSSAGQIVLCDSNPHSSSQNWDLSTVLRDRSSFCYLASDLPKALDVSKKVSKSSSIPLGADIFSFLILAKRQQLPKSMARALAESQVVCNQGMRHACETFKRQSQQMPPRDSESMPPGVKVRLYLFLPLYIYIYIFYDGLLIFYDGLRIFYDGLNFFQRLNKF